MKKHLLTLSLIVLGTLFSLAQTTITISGKVTDNITNNAVASQTVFISGDSIYNPATSSMWTYFDSATTNSSGDYSKTISIPGGITQGIFSIYTFDCNRQLHSKYVYFPNSVVTANFSICTGVPSSCFADFQTYADSTNSLKYYFVDNSTGNPTQWSWNFGDGNSSSVKNPTHTYSQHGTYNVTLAISDSASNCASTYSYSLKTQQNTNNCKAYFYSFPDQTNTKKINFIADSSSGSTYTWNFGDSTSGTGQTIQHTYSSSGVYSVCLTITKTNCTDTYCETIRVASTGCSSYFNYSKNGKAVSFYGDSTNSANATYTWSFGDSSTGTGQYVQHTYSSFGTYHACLTISHSGISCTPHCESITLGTNPSYSSIGGAIFAGRNYVDKATAYLIYFNPQDSTLTAIDTFNVDSSGLYYFGNVAAGTYLLKAALRSQSSYYQNYMPTYYDTVLFWNQATDVVCSGNNFVQCDIHMLQGNNPGGPGFIGGKVNKGANFRSNYMKGIQIMLVDEFDRPVAYTFSDGKGEFSFENIALGSYKVYAEIIGKISYSANVVIDETNKTSDNITFTVNDDNISVSINNQFSDMIKSIGNIYPNPSSNAVNINVSIVKPVEFNISILNQLGQIVLTTKENLQTGNNIISLEVSQLEMGFYTVLINSSDNSQIVRKFMKIK